MKKHMLLVLLMAGILLFTGSCSLIVKDPEVDKQTVVLEINGKQFLKGQVQPMIQEEVEYQQYVYQYQYGMVLDSKDPELVAYAQETVMQNLIQQTVLEQKLEEGGYAALTEEEKKVAQESAQVQYESSIEEILAGDLADSELTGDELRAEAERILVEQQYATLEELVAYEEQNIADEKLYQEVVKDVAVSEEDIRATYDQKVETARADYEYDPQYFDMDVSDGVTIYYYPEGYRYVKHILFSFSEEEEEAIAQLEQRVMDAQDVISELQLQVDDGSVAADDETFLAEHRAAEDALAVAEQELAASQEAAYAALQPKVEEVQTALAAGEDFDALVEKYGQDPGMTNEPAKTQGYVVGASSTNYVEAFRDGALALSTVGEVSEPVRTEYGLHLIKYIGDITEGPVPYEQLKDELAETALREKQDTAFSEVLSRWMEEANVKKYLKRLED